MFIAKIENLAGQILTLTQNESNYQVVDIQGLNPPNAQINLSSIAGLDGAKFNSSKIDTRNIVITIKLNGDVESNRQALYRFFPTKQWCKFYYQNSNRNVFIEGYVEANECDFFSDSERMQISIICPRPYFKDVEEIVDDISNIVARFTFPFSIEYDDPIPFSEYSLSTTALIYNASEAETGTEININVVTPFNKISIRNTLTGDWLTLENSFLANDKIIINTNKGEKSITLIRNGVSSNLMGSLVLGSTFFQLASGDNMFGYIVDDDLVYNDYATVKFIFHNKYGGV